jgi:hypothetical protein
MDTTLGIARAMRVHHSAPLASAKPTCQVAEGWDYPRTSTLCIEAAPLRFALSHVVFPRRGTAFNFLQPGTQRAQPQHPGEVADRETEALIFAYAAFLFACSPTPDEGCNGTTVLKFIGSFSLEDHAA